MSNLSLHSGSRVAIIGGGPAGSFFAYFLHKYSIEKDLELEVTIFDGKNFLLKGPKGCNLCAGVVSENLNLHLKAEGIHLPEDRIIHRIDGYCLHHKNEQLFLTGEGEKTDRIATVFRGNGPRYSKFSGNISFDDFLLTLAQDYGAAVQHFPVQDITLPEQAEQPVQIHFGPADKVRKQEFDLVVGAFGVHSQLADKVTNLGFGYSPPATLRTFQAEVLIDREKMAQDFGNFIHVYMPRSKIIRYVTAIPKGDFLSLSFVGRQDMNPQKLPEFFDFARAQNIPAGQTPQCTCFPRIVVSAVRKPYTHKLVMIGDASCTRYYKNGIESAFITAKLAARAAVFHGIDAQSFAVHYLRPARHTIIRDNRYGRLLFFLNDVISNIPPLRKANFVLAGKTKRAGTTRILRSILWNMFTGNLSYREIFKKALSPKLQLALLIHSIRACFSK